MPAKKATAAKKAATRKSTKKPDSTRKTTAKESTTAKKTTSKKTTGTRTTSKSASKKAAATKSVSKKVTAVEGTIRKTATKRKSAKKSVAAETTSPPKSAEASTSPDKVSQPGDPKPKSAPPISKAKEKMLSARKRSVTPAHFKPIKKSNTPVIFTMEDVAEMLNKRKSDEPEPTTKKVKVPRKKVVEIKPEPVASPRNHAAASMLDILGFDPAATKAKTEADVPAEWKGYYQSLVDLRNHLREGLDLHTEETLKRSAKDDSGDLSGYGQHMADAGTDAFDRDFALSLVSSEQEALYEIEKAIERIYKGTYGRCEITGEPIAAERLEAVPFTRYSLEGQRELERNRRAKGSRGGVFSDLDDDDLVMTDDDDS